MVKENIAYFQKAFAEGWVLASGLKDNASGGLTIIKADSIEHVNDFLDADPLKVSGIQEYRVVEFEVQYFNPMASELFKN
ncbi:hypothetical protein DCMF_23435 [Candidatus Formimonas warabiya]|uniref:YCII-related domain-containing protein n=2 Tax=Formimonas warabiya TaxID=1761012 RepID=A0A3G1KY73_FORW1|nr:hypothetical protein DCMF_23435 [Candidatus Formimonas warabiya]